ncbi:trypco2 family protein [Streptomyces sp. NPDC020875]|uniref:trypco2 family protein n=1 Tax=Streptomyces sp. NPDC020875 TaxID=3154898 RepID=UPI0034096C02
MTHTDPGTPGPGSGIDAGIDLADAVDAVRAQLVTAAARANGSPVRFEVDGIELEFTVELRRDTTGGGRVRAWVVDAGAERTTGTGRTHRVAVTLTPRGAGTNDSWLVGNDDLDISADFGRDGTGHDGASGTGTP